MSRTPADIAREAFKTLTARREAPTPELYWQAYQQIAGMADTIPEHALVQALLAVLPSEPAQARKELQQAASQRDWKKFTEVLGKQFEQQATSGRWAQPWPQLIKELLRQWDLRQSGLTTQRKQDMLQRVLVNFGKDPHQLNEKLLGLTRAWNEYGQSDSVADADLEDTAPALPTEAAAAVVVDMQSAWKEAQELVARTLEIGLAPRLAGMAELAAEANNLALQARNGNWPAQLSYFQAQIRKFWVRLELQGDKDARLVLSMNNVLRLLLENLSSVAVDDPWLGSQYAAVEHLFDGELDMQTLYRAELSLKELLYKQGALKHSLDEAKTQLKNLIATFVDRLGTLSDSTGVFHDRVHDYSERIRSATNIADIAGVLDKLMHDTKAMQMDVQRSRDELLDARKQVTDAELRISELETELQAISDKVREDQLTGALNRRGLEDAVTREIARADRQLRPLALGLLDLDNFKRLNDRLGHQAGDEALKHLVLVVNDVLRPTDAIARYGGEEFIIVLPDTNVEAAVATLQRLQRELTRRFFLHNNERLLITFSAGITVFEPLDTLEAVIARADDAMYRAKRAGKNRVEVA